MTTKNLNHDLVTKAREAIAATLADVSKRLEQVRSTKSKSVDKIEELNVQKDEILAEAAAEKARLEQMIRLNQQRADDNVADVEAKISSEQEKIEVLDEEIGQLEGILSDNEQEADESEPEPRPEDSIPLPAAPAPEPEVHVVQPEREQPAAVEFPRRPVERPAERTASLDPVPTDNPRPKGYVFTRIFAILGAVIFGWVAYETAHNDSFNDLATTCLVIGSGIIGFICGSSLGSWFGKRF